jgi:hypothetical protein
MLVVPVKLRRWRPSSEGRVGLIVKAEGLVLVWIRNVGNGLLVIMESKVSFSS